MKLIKGILTLIGALVVLGLIALVIRYGNTLANFDKGGLGAYMEMAQTVLDTGDPAKAMVMKRKLVIPEGTDKMEAIRNAVEIMDEVAEKYGMVMVDRKTMPRKTKVFTHIRSYCSPAIADKFLEHSAEYVGFMPCRVGIVEEPNGEIYLYTMKLDLMIHGGKKLPPELMKLAQQVKMAMEEMVIKGASGEDL